MILCLGPIGSGKTLLLRLLKEENPHTGLDGELLFTVPTVGVNIINLSMKKGRNSSVVTVRELGGCMAPIWSQHFSDCSGILYVIDARNLQQVSAASILLLEMVNHPKLKSIPICILLNKIDIRTSSSILEVRDVLMLNEVCRHATQNITVIETSCVTGKGIATVKEWLEQVS